jgi:hypothetical protein
MCPRKIWQDVDELAFDENAILLGALACSQVERRNRTDLAWARDSLGDFALIAAGPGEATNVAAACQDGRRKGRYVRSRNIKSCVPQSPVRTRRYSK